MTGPSRPVLRVVADARPDPVDELLAAADPPGPAAPGPDPGTLHAEIGADVARLTGAAGLGRRWDAVRAVADPDDLRRLDAHVAAVREAAASVRRQHTETAEDLGPLWDTWAGPAAEAVQNRVSALARSAHALVVELEGTADRLTEARTRIVDALEALADELADTVASHVDPDAPGAACDRAAAACTAAWADVRRVFDGEAR